MAMASSSHHPFFPHTPVKRRGFLMGLTALPGLLSAVADPPVPAPSAPVPLELTRTGQLRIVLQDRLEHPFYEWPRTLLSYPVQLAAGLEPQDLELVRVDSGERVPIQFSDLTRDADGSRQGILHFFSDLPSGARREFVLGMAASPRPWPDQVLESHEANTVVLDSGAVRVRIPASQDVLGEAPGPVMQISRGDAWFGESHLTFGDDPVRKITTRRTASGPLFICYELTYETAGNARYVASVQCEAGMDFVRFEENMEGLPAGHHGLLTLDWTGLGATHRQAPNHPFPLTDDIRNYADYP